VVVTGDSNWLRSNGGLFPDRKAALL